MPEFNDGFLGVPARPGKPREVGITHVIDKGLNLRDIEGLFDTGGQFVDIVKFGWGTSYVTNNLEKKIALYRSFETPVVCGGTLFEAVYGRDRIDDFKRWLTEHRFSHVEISDGTLEIPRDRKLELIADFSRDFIVLSEVGSKDPDVVYAPYQWVEWINEELAAGAWKVITEGREGGTAGIFRSDGDMRTGLLDEPRLEVVHPAPAVDRLEQGPAADDGRLERAVERDLLLEVVRDVPGAPAELDDVDEVPCGVEEPFDLAEVQSLVDDVRESAATRLRGPYGNAQESVCKARHRMEG